MIQYKTKNSYRTIFTKIIQLFVLLALFLLGAPLGVFLVKNVWLFLSIYPPNGYIYELCLSAGSIIGGFIVGTYFYCIIYKENNLLKLIFSIRSDHATLVGWTLLSTFSAMLLMSDVAYWNLQIKLPSFLRSFEMDAQQYHAMLEKRFLFFTTFSSITEFVFALCIIGGLTAMGEELFFRGGIQPIFAQLANNSHVAILLTAFFFSAVHFDFYLFFPRLFMGILLGYFYFWTGRLFFPIIAHFFNNSLVLVKAYIEQARGPFLFSNKDLLPLPVLIIVSFLFVWLLILFAKKASLLKN